MSADPFLYSYTSPLQGYEGLEPLSEVSPSNVSFLDPTNEPLTVLTSERNEDGKSYKNPAPTTKAQAYSSFPEPITNGIRGGFDIHIYYMHTDEFQFTYAKQLWERIRREFPELRIYRVWEAPIGPHPMAMFEVNVFTPEQFGAFIPWLVVHRGPLSALIHPNTGDDVRDHTQRATWMGTPVPLNTSVLPGFSELKERLNPIKAKQ